MKIVLAHPGVGPFVQQAARALLEAGLASYSTTFADQPDVSWRRALVRVGTAFGIGINSELERRAVKEVPASHLRCLTLLGARKDAVGPNQSGPTSGGRGLGV